MRLDAYVAKYWPEQSRSLWSKLIKQGYVKVNEVIQTSPKLKVGEDDVVTVDTLPVVGLGDNTLPVVYEDEHVVVINKPSGILTHAKGALTEEFSVAEFVRPIQNETDNSNRPGIVHRLDRATSGVIICSKDNETKRLLQKQFQDRKAHKTYLAIVDGQPKLNEARINLPIERNPKNPSCFRVGSKGKPAITNYRVLACSENYSVVELTPSTGRTHQLRVHLAYLGCPIVGDTLYGGSQSPLGRLCLHASQLEITIPPGQRRTFEAALPTDFKQFLSKLGHEA